MRADAALTVANALIEAAGISLAAPTKTIGTAGLANSAVIVATGGGALDGIALSGGTSTLNGAILTATGATKNDVVLDATTQNGGVVSANGFITTPSLAQNGGTLIAVGNIAVATLLNQTSGAIEAGGNLTLGQGTGQAGAALSQAGAGTVSLGGSLVAGGDIDLWDATGSTVQISGAVLANGRVGLTASGGVSQTGGTIAGGRGVALLATTGNAAQIAATSIVAGGTAAGQGVSIEAPKGTENFTSFGRSGIVVASIAAGPWTLECPACQIPIPAAFAAPTAAVPLVTANWSGAPDVTLATGRVPVLLVGASIDLPSSVLASTLSLYASGNITEQASAAITANLLTGRAGLVATDAGEAQFGFTPTTPTATTSGSVALGSAGNAIDTLGDFLATAGIALTDAPTNAASTLTIINGATIAAVSGGYGGVFGGNLSITVAGNIAVDAWLGAQAANGAGGSLALTAAGGGIALGATGLQAVLAATQTANLHADNAITVSNGLINAGAVTLDARAKTIGATGVANSGIVISTGAASGDGITLSGGISTLNGATLSATGAARNDIALDAAIQTSGVVSANGSITLISLAQSGGTVIAGGGVALSAALNQSGGAILAGGNVVVGAGAGAAGLALSTASAGAATIGGVVAAGGDVRLWDVTASGAQISGSVLANGVVGATAANGIAQTGGTIAGAAGVALLAQTGAATQSGGAIVAAGGAAGQGVAVQAPAGLENFSSFGRDAITVASITPAGSWAVECPSCTVPLPASFVAPAGAAPVASGAARAGSIDITASTGLIPVALLGGSIEIQSVILRASSLGLYASGGIAEDPGGVVIASTLNGSAGIASTSVLPAGVTALGWTTAAQLGGGWTAPSTGDARLGGIPALTGGGSEVPSGGGALLLSNANSIATLGAFTATGTFTLADATALTIGPVAAAALPLNARGVNVGAWGGAVQATQGATIAVAGGLTVAGAINAAAIELVANRFLSSAATQSSATGSISIAGALFGANVGLYSETSITDAGGAGLISAGALTGRAGVLTAGAAQLPGNFTAVDTAGSLSLTNPANAIATLDTVLATAGIALTDAPTGSGSLLTIASTAASGVAAVDAGYGGVFGGDLAITVAGNIAVQGWLGAQAGNQAGSGPAGNIALVAANGLTIGSTATQAVLAASAVANLQAGGAITVVNGLINAAGIGLNAPTKTIGVAGVANSGLLVSTGGGALDGIILTGGASTLNGAILSATGAAGADVTLDRVTQNGGLISANGFVAAPSLAQTAGALDAGGPIVIAGSLLQLSGGSITTGGNLNAGQGGGVAGMAQSTPIAGGLYAAGRIVAGGDVSLWDNSAGAVQLSGTIVAGGTIGLTAAQGIAQTAGVVDGARGVALYAVNGSAGQATTALVGAGSAGGQGVAVQAPNGDETFSSFGRSAFTIGAIAAAGPWSLECPSCAIAPPASFAAPAASPPAVSGGAVGGSIDVSTATGRVPVTLVGRSVTLDANVLASTLQLYAQGNIVEQPNVVIDATVLTGSAGVQATPALAPGLAALGWTVSALGWTTPQDGSALLGMDPAIATNPPPVAAWKGLQTNENAIATLADFTVTQTLLLHDAIPLAIGSPNNGAAIAVALSPSGTTALAFGGNLSATRQGGGGTIDITSDNAITQTGQATWSASRIVLTAQTGDLTLASGGKLTVLTDGPPNVDGVFPRPASAKPPTDPTTTTSSGASFSAVAGSIHVQSGVTIAPLTGRFNPLARFILGTTDPSLAPGNSGVIDLTGGVSSVQPETLANAATVILYLSNGTGIGSLNVGALEVFYTGSDNRALTAFTNSSLLNAQGQLLTGTVAASLASIALTVPNGAPPTTFKPSHSITLNGCPIASVNCTILSTQLLPAGSPLRDIAFGTLNDSDDDPDFLLPSVSDQDY